MSQTYCEECGSMVEVRGRRCLAGHLIEPPRQVPTLRRPRLEPGDEYRSTLLEMMGLSNVEDQPVPPPASGPPLLAAPARTIPPRSRPAGAAKDGEGGNGEPHPGMIERLWTEDHTETQLGDDWVPGLMPSDDQQFLKWRRWWPVLLLVVLVIGSLLLLNTLRNAPRRTADAVRARYAVAAADLETSTAELGPAIVTITDPAATDTELTDATVALNIFEADIAAAEAQADADLPSPPPFGSANPIEALGPIRQRLLFAVDLAGAIADRLSAVYTYRLLLTESFMLPPLPDVALEEEIPDLRVSLAAAVADTRRAVTDLPDDDLLATHRQQAVAVADRMEAWQAEYLDALRRSDAPAVAALKSEITTLVSTLRSSLADPLGVIRVNAQGDAASLTSVIARVNAELETSG